MQSQPKTLTIQGKQFYAEHWQPIKTLVNTNNKKTEPVIALHGWLDNCKSFQPLAPHLKNCEVLALDMAGHGQSDHRSEDAAYHIWDDVKEVLLIADAMGWEKFTLLGHSRGAIISVMIAAVAPERIKQLILLEGLLPLTAEEHQTAEKLKKHLQKALHKESLQRKQQRIYPLEQMIAIRRQGGFGITEEAAKLIIEHGTEKIEGGYRWRNDLRLLMHSPLMLTPGQAMDFLLHVQCPITLLTASQVMGQNLDKIREMLRCNKDVTIVEFEGGHHFHMESDVIGIAECVTETLSK